MKASKIAIKKIPYGISDYEKIINGNYYYVDKTPFLKTIEETGNYLFFIRPRRFGKSLFLSLAQAYYDTYYKSRFEELFKGTWIFDHPTDERNKYLILAFNFSAIDPDPHRVSDSFTHHIRTRAVSFLYRYHDALEHRQRDDLLNKLPDMKSAADILLSIIELCSLLEQKVYILIDEYDNFANTLLSTSGTDSYHDLTHGAGFFRSFFNVLKSGTTGMGAPVSRSIITGVSPITMDDVTSGYNIGRNISLDSKFNRMLGFTEEEVAQMFKYYSKSKPFPGFSPQLQDIVSHWYGNYLFSENDHCRMYNSDMVLYFIDNCISQKRIPDELIDRNVRIDYSKLRHLIVIDRGKNQTPITNGNFSKLKAIIEEEGTTTKISSGFPLEEMADAKNFKSLLFYFGLLTIQGQDRDRLRLTIPNETVKHLFFDYIKDAYHETRVFSSDQVGSHTFGQ